MNTISETSVIVCSRNRRDLLRDCVESILGGTVVPSELIIVDQSDASDPFLARLSAPGCAIRYEWQRVPGLSRAENLAVGLARNDVLVFTNDDVLVDRTWLAAIVQALVRAGPRVLVTGRVEVASPEVGGGFVSDLSIESGRAVYSQPIERDVLYAANMAMHRSAFDAVGPFDERLGPGTRFPAAEDGDFALRAFRSGFSIVHEPAALVCHRPWREEAVHARFRWGYGFARGGFYGKHLSLRDRYTLRRLMLDVLNHMSPLPRLALRDPRQAFGHVALAAGVIAGTVCWLICESRSGRACAPPAGHQRGGEV